MQETLILWAFLACFQNPSISSGELGFLRRLSLRSNRQAQKTLSGFLCRLSPSVEPKLGAVDVDRTGEIRIGVLHLFVFVAEQRAAICVVELHFRISS